jgi:hypothetical protein
MLILERLNEVKIPIVALQARPGTAELNHTYEDDFFRLMSVPLGLRLLACFAVLAVASSQRGFCSTEHQRLISPQTKSPSLSCFCVTTHTLQSVLYMYLIMLTI